MSQQDDDPNGPSDVRALRISFLLGVVAGLGHGIPRYGMFSIGNVGMVGLGIITIVGLHALVIALLPSRGTGSDATE